MKKAEKYSITISIIALTVSIGTLLLTSPLIIDYIRKPVLRVAGSYPMIYDDRVVTWFMIGNTGGLPARGIVLKIICFKNDSITFPQAGYTTVHLRTAADISVQLSGIIQERVYEVGELLPHLPIWLVIASSKKDYSEYASYRKRDQKAFPASVPAITNVSAAGAEIKAFTRRVEPERIMVVPDMEKPKEIDRSQR